MTRPFLSHAASGVCRLAACGPTLHSHAHAAHAAAHAAHHWVGLVVLDVCDHGFGGEHQAGDRGGVLQRGMRYFGRIDDACGDEGLRTSRSLR